MLDKAITFCVGVGRGQGELDRLKPEPDLHQMYWPMMRATGMNCF